MFRAGVGGLNLRVGHANRWAADGDHVIDLNSARWAELSHAYGSASDVPDSIERLKDVSSSWNATFDELTSAILHQGDVYTGTYAAMPHLLQLADELGACPQSDMLLDSIAYASRGGVGPEVPGFLEEAWDDMQDDARDLILDRLVTASVAEQFAADLIVGLLSLSGEWDWAEYLRKWVWGYSIDTKCLNCGNEHGVLWHEGRTRHARNDHSIHDFDVLPSTEIGIVPDHDLEFDGDHIRCQHVTANEAG